MTSYIVNLKIIKKSDEMIILSQILAKKLQIENNQLIKIAFGINNEHMVRLKTIKSDTNDIYITTTLRHKLLIPYSKKLMIKKDTDGLSIGPIIGILTTDYLGKKFLNTNANQSNPFSLFFKSLLSPEPIYPAYYFVFTPENVDWLNMTINGYFYMNHTWKKMKMPLPHVIYNRIPNRTIERKEYIENFKTAYINYGGKIFNSNFFNKWYIYHLLVGDEKTKKFIPETYLNPSTNKLDEMVNKHPIVYLKPANGSLGLGIYKILKRKNGYIVQHRRGNYNRSQVFYHTASIYKYIFSKKNRRNYMVQQGINLIKYQENPVDFRLHLHKNQLNKWEVTAIGAKVAGKDSVTTHLRTGGKLLDANQFLQHVFNSQKSAILEHVTHSSILIAKSLESKIASPIGELGLDIGIDQNQRIWLFEVNSKPGRSIFKHPSLKEARMESNKRLIEYGIFLSDFKLMTNN